MPSDVLRRRKHDSQREAERPLYQLIGISILQIAISFTWAVVLGTTMQFKLTGMVSNEAIGRHTALIFGLGALFSAIYQLTIGAVSDQTITRIGRRKPYVLIGIPIAVTGLFAYASAHSFPILLLSYLLLQLSVNTVAVPYQALLPDLIPPSQHGRAAALISFFMVVGQALGLLSLKFFDIAQGSNIFVVYSIVSLLFILLGGYSLLAVREAVLSGMKGSAAVRGPEALPAGAEASFGIAADIPQPSTFSQAIRNAFRGMFRFEMRENRDFYLLVFSRMLVYFSFYTYLNFLYYFVSASLRIASPQTQTPMILLAGTLGTLPTALAVGRLADKMSKKMLIVVSVLFSASAYILFALATSMNMVLILGVLIGIGYGAFISVDWAFGATLMPKGRGGRFMGVWDLTTLAPQIVAPAIMGIVRDILVNFLSEGIAYRIMFLSVVIPYMLSLILVARISRDR